MNNQNAGYDGALISKLGVKRYLKGVKAQGVSNIDFFNNWGRELIHSKS